MVQEYKGHYSFNKDIIQDWNNNQGGIYYCGIINGSGELTPYYIGKAYGDGGIRGRLLQHLSENKWRDITHFGYKICSSENESLMLEKQEIAKYNPKYNIQGTY